MRRSAAPSQANAAAKRPKFVPPALSSRWCSPQTSEEYSPVSTAASGNCTPPTQFKTQSFPFRSVPGRSTAPQTTGKDKENKKGNNSPVTTPTEGLFTKDWHDQTKNGSNNDKHIPQIMKSSDSSGPGICQKDVCDSNLRTHNYDDDIEEAEDLNRSNGVNSTSRTLKFWQGQSDNSCIQLEKSSVGCRSAEKSSSGKRVSFSSFSSSNRKGNSSTYSSFDEESPQRSVPHQNGSFGSTPKMCSSQDADETKMQYFSVVWCKLSKKKHKKWEGDAILSTKKRSATLYDIEGKVIGKGTGYKIADLENLKEDETLAVGGKEILVMAKLTEEHFKSGKCFTAAGSCVEDSKGPDLKSNAGHFKPFVNPMKSSTNRNPQGIEAGKMPVMTPRHDATLPNALVMPRPGGHHQWKNSHQGSTVVDVVVDPYLSTSLRDHQRDGIVFLYECVMGMRDYDGHGAILADDMGLGKTLQCIALIWTLLKQGPYGKPVIKKVLVITPGSLVKNWSQEFKKWLGTERLNVFAVSSDKRIEDYMRTDLHPVLITSYEMFVRCYEIIKNVTFDLIVCDEGHRLKNTAIKTTSMIMSLPCRRRIVLTGTPIQNDLQEFYSIVEFCNPGVLGSSAAFRRVFEEPIILSRQPKASVPEQEIGHDRAEELTRLTQMFVLRRTQEINNDYLPSKVELVLFCRMSPLQNLLYHQLIGCNLVRQCLGGNLTGSPHLICIGALKQLCNHPGLVYKKAAEAEMTRNETDDSQTQKDSIYRGLVSTFPDTFNPSVVSPQESGKLQVLFGILSSIWSKSNDEKVVLVSNHTKTLDFLQVFCNSQGYSFLRLDGQTPTAQRLDIVNRFNNKYSPHRIFLLSSKAGGVGLNLVGASRLILYDIDWNPANDLQAMARVWRDGQRRKVHIYRLLTTGTIEEKIYQRQIAKQGLSGAVMDMNNKNNVQFSVEELKNLFRLNETTDCETHNMLKCSCDGDPLYTPKQVELDATCEKRSCQLGKPANDKIKSGNLTMAELLRWKHLKGESIALEKTWCLEQAVPGISFLFWHESNCDNTSTS